MLMLPLRVVCRRGVWLCARRTNNRVGSRSPRFQEHSVDDRALPLALEPSLTPPRSADGRSHEVILSMDDS